MLHQLLELGFRPHWRTGVFVDADGRRVWSRAGMPMLRARGGILPSVGVHNGRGSVSGRDGMGPSPSPLELQDLKEVA